MSLKQKITYYLGITLGITFIMQAYIGSDYTSTNILLMMWLPGLVAIAFTLLDKEKRFGTLGLRLRRPFYLVMAVAIPALTFAITAGGSALLFEGSIRWGDYGLMTMTDSFELNLLITVIVVVAKACLAALGEELGWRGYAQSRMMTSFGTVKGIVILGIVWGYWHVGVTLTGPTFQGAPLLSALVLMPLACIGMSFMFAWLTLKSGSVWPAAVAHGITNVLFDFSFLLTDYKGSAALYYTWIITVILIMGGIFMYLIKRMGTMAANSMNNVS
ncbi:CPBP family intramembrane metalloprotease [Paenibacillus sp. GSMTC-2017]|uniref:CPBP family intramembrane glutamic endopeptidase n=1 Tax=Paenibacillus sp. GSMTC-2017 TaxID=2794350 RepID=UPI0018D5DFF6|nr:type II CAAX endopeptidase family protein [Paenibacillus sp. GSMTC-2017]MBH5319447.1 CPBP family intramembrane metalloprotease [Paenibacillus sp. GSMTC-2017]